MPIGSIQELVVCGIDNGSVSASGRPIACTMSNGTAGALITSQGYIIDVSQAVAFEASNGPFDYAIASAIWGMAFTFVVGLYLVSKSAGMILNRIKA